MFRQYRGSRDKDEFMSFVEERRWEEVEVVPAWKSPGSLQMSIVAQFFKVLVSLTIQLLLVKFFQTQSFPPLNYVLSSLQTSFLLLILSSILSLTFNLFSVSPLQPFLYST